MKSDKLIGEEIILDEYGFLSKNFQTNRIVAEYSEYFNLGMEVNKYAYILYGRIAPSRTDKIDCYFCQAFAKAHKDFQACMLLAGRGMRDQSEVLTRILLENLFVITAIHKDNDKYIEWEQAQKCETNKNLRKVKKVSFAA